MIFQNFQEYTTAKQIEPSLLERIEALSEKDKEIIKQIGFKLLLSANNFREIFQLSKEICIREKISFQELFNQKDFKEIIFDDSSLSPKDKLKKLKQLLEAKRFPETEIIKNKILSNSQMIFKKYGLKLVAPADFEGTTFSLNLNFNSQDQLGDLVKKLEFLKADESLKEIFAILKGEKDEL